MTFSQHLRTNQNRETYRKCDKTFDRQRVSKSSEKKNVMGMFWVQLFLASLMSADYQPLFRPLEQQHFH